MRSTFYFDRDTGVELDPREDWSMHMRAVAVGPTQAMSLRAERDLSVRKRRLCRLLERQLSETS